MSEKIHVLAQQLFGKSSIEECDLQEIKNLAQHNPYFAPAQFFLLEKMKKENSSVYHAQLQKSVLYYHNPLAFEYFISSDRFYTEVNFDEELRDEGQETRDKEERTGKEQEARYKLQAANYEQDEEAQATSYKQDENLIQENKIENVIEENIHYPEKELSEVAEVQNEATIESEKTVSAETSQLQTPNSKLQTDLTFEPFHTVDYFASQGIKLSQEEMPKDKLGKQLKSFTEWLKTMKRLPANEVSKIDSSTEQKVEHMAEDSVHNPDVVTEAMAEVWIKQGNIQKALEVYNKLSLLNPSKKPYFAGLIENLKRS
jgi:hypothetical protein